MAEPVTRKEHRTRMSASSSDFREGVAYACDVMRQDLFWTLLGGGCVQDLMRRLEAESNRLRAVSDDSL